MNKLKYYNGKLKDEKTRYNYIVERKHTKEEIKSQVDILLKLRLKLLKLSPLDSKRTTIPKIRKCEGCEDKYITENPNRFVCFKCLPEKTYEARFVGEVRFNAMDLEEAEEIAGEFTDNIDLELIDISEERIIKNQNF